VDEDTTSWKVYDKKLGKRERNVEILAKAQAERRKSRNGCSKMQKETADKGWD